MPDSIDNNTYSIETGVNLNHFSKSSIIRGVKSLIAKINEIIADLKTNFTDLDDTPSDLSSNGNKFVRVNSGGTALEFPTSIPRNAINSGAPSNVVTNDTNGYLSSTTVLPLSNLPIIDDDSMVTASAAFLPTSESVKAYVDSQTHLELGNTGVTAMAGDTDIPNGGWFESTSRIKIMPTDFMSNDDRTTPYMVIEDDTPAGKLGIRAAHGAVELYSFIPIPSNYRATRVQIYASGNGEANCVHVFDHNITTGSIAAVQTTGDTYFNNTIIFSSALSSSIDNNLVLRLSPDGIALIIYGGHVVIEKQI